MGILITILVLFAVFGGFSQAGGGRRQIQPGVGPGAGAGYGGGGFRSKRQIRQDEETQLADAQADARRWVDRLGGQVLNLEGTDTASKQAMADASERYTAARSAMADATTVKQARLARESALEGMHYVNAAREIMGMPAGPELLPLEGQRKAGKVTERRTVEQDGKQLTASPYASQETPNYYPGGVIAGRPVPAGWYSYPWWAGALQTGVWMMGYSMLFNSLFMGMSGVGYTGEEAAAGDFGGDAGDAGDADAGDADAGDAGDADGGDADAGDAGDGDFGDAGGDDGGFFGGGGDDGGFFGGGGDDGGGFFGGGDDGGGLFDFGFDF